MKTHVRVLVVGGGAVGAGIAYALAKAGWTDLMLVERDELTSGSTWHAAGLLPYFNMSYATTHIHDHSIKLYKMLEEETGLNPGFSVVGNLRMAQTQARMDEYMLYAATAENVDVPYEWMTPDQIKDRWPLVRTEDLFGAIFHPTDGYINPADVTQALARGARNRGVAIERRWQADAFRWTGSAWIVTLTKMVARGGNLVPSEERMEVTAEHLVTASGNHAQRTARLLDIKIPAIPVEHQYIVTEPDPALQQYRLDHGEHPVLRDADAKWYVREERGGWILGPYEKGAPARFAHGVPELVPRRPLPPRPRPDRGRVHELHPPHPVGRGGRAQGRLQRPDLLHARRQPAARPRAGPAQHVAGRGVLLRHHRGGRRRALPRAADDRGRGRDRHDLARPAPLRHLDDDRVRLPQERGGLRPRLRPAPPRRGAAGGTAAADGALLRPPGRARRPVRSDRGMGAADLLRRTRLRRPCRPLVPPRRLVVLRGGRGAGDP